MEKELAKATWQNFTGPEGLSEIGDLEPVNIIRTESAEIMVAVLGKYKCE